MTKRIAIIVEGATEQAFRTVLRKYPTGTLAGKMPKLTFLSKDGRIPTGERLKRDALLLLRQNDAVIVLTDVYTGPRPFDFANAADAKDKMRQWVGAEPRFYASSLFGMGRNGLPNLRVARRIVSGSGICQATIGMIGQFLCSAGGRFFVPA